MSMKRQTIPHIVMDPTWFGAFVLYNYADVENAVTISVMSSAGYLAKTITKTIAAFGRVTIGQEEVGGSGTFSVLIDGPDDLSVIPQQMDKRTGIFLPIPVHTPSSPVTLKKG